MLLHRVRKTVGTTLAVVLTITFSVLPAWDDLDPPLAAVTLPQAAVTPPPAFEFPHHDADRYGPAIRSAQPIPPSSNPATAVVIPRIVFLNPTSRSEIGAWQTIRFQYLHGTSSLVPQLVFLQAENSELSSLTVLTDEDGYGEFRIRSGTAQQDSVIVLANRAAADHPITFFEPDPEDEPYIGQYPLKSNGTTVILKIENDRIGIMTDDIVTRAQVETWASRLGLRLVRRPSGNLFILATEGSYSQNARWDLADRLKQMANCPQDGSCPDNNIVAAGLVTHPGISGNPIVIESLLFVRFKSEVTDPLSILATYPVSVIGTTGYDDRVFAIRPQPEHVTQPAEDPLKIALDLTARKDVDFAHPEFAQMFILRGTDDASLPNPEELELFSSQWHLDNQGANGALDDADIDAPGAWSFTMGSERTTIAVLDLSFYLQHEELKKNLVARDRIIDLADDDNEDLLWDEVIGAMEYRHGTNAAGVALARGDTGQVAGVCPYCRFMPIRMPDTFVTQHLFEALNHAVGSNTGESETQGVTAQVISMSMGWELSGGFIERELDVIGGGQAYTTEEIETYTAQSARQAVLVFAMPNSDTNICPGGDGKPVDSSAIRSAIAVGGASDRDYRIRNAQGKGNCMDLLAFTGDRKRQKIWTSSVQYKDGAGPVEQEEFDAFQGTSAATPQVAGTAALVIDASYDPDSGKSPMSPQVVRRALQDTADRIHPSKAAYQAENGFSLPKSGVSTYGYGRINAFEAVRLAAPVEQGGRNNTDGFLRDHDLDWGNTEQPSDILFQPKKVTKHEWKRPKVKKLKSADIRIDVEPWQNTEQTGLVANDPAFPMTSERPRSGKNNRVFIRARNRGSNEVVGANIALYWTLHRKRLDPEKLPVRVCESDAENLDDCWHLLPSDRPPYTIAYSGASVAGCPGRQIPECPPGPGDTVMRDGARVQQFDLPTPLKWGSRYRLALLAIISADNDKPVMELADVAEGGLIPFVTKDNNVTLWMD